MRILAALLLVALLDIPTTTHAVPLEALRALVSASTSGNPTAARCVAVRVEVNRLLAPSSCTALALDTLDYVRDDSLVDAAAVGTDAVSVALSTESVRATPTLLWKDDAIQRLRWAIQCPSFPPPLTEDTFASIVDVDATTMRVSIVDQVVYVDSSRCRGSDNATTTATPDDSVCVMPRTVGDRSKAKNATSSSSTRFLIQRDVTRGRHVLLGVGRPLAKKIEYDGLRAFAWLPRRLSATDATSNVAREADRVLGQPVSTITPATEFIAGIRDAADGPSFCTGSLILPRFVVTAARCAHLGHKVTHVAVGSLGKAGDVGDRIAIKRTYVHPRFNSSSATSTYDIMLLELEQASRRTPIQLYRAGGNVVGKRATVMGYGASEFKDNLATPSTTLHAVELPILGPSSTACAAKLQLKLDESVLCTSGEPGKAVCVGDAGGPLVLEPNTPNQKLLGVVSYDRGCGSPGYTGVYTRVDKVLTFINDVTKINYKGPGMVWNTMGK